MSNQSKLDALQKYDEYLTDAFGDIIVCGITMDSGHVLKECDPIGYREGFNNWIDAEDINLV